MRLAVEVKQLVEDAGALPSTFGYACDFIAQQPSRYRPIHPRRAQPRPRLYFLRSALLMTFRELAASPATGEPSIRSKGQVPYMLFRRFSPLPIRMLPFPIPHAPLLQPSIH